MDLLFIIGIALLVREVGLPVIEGACRLFRNR
jgi:hypothetical protein